MPRPRAWSWRRATYRGHARGRARGGRIGAAERRPDHSRSPVRHLGARRRRHRAHDAACRSSPSRPTARVAGNGVYLLGIMPDQQVDRAIAFRGAPGARPLRRAGPGRRLRRHRARRAGAGERAPGRRGRPHRALCAPGRAHGASRSCGWPLSGRRGGDTPGAPPFDAVFIPQGGPALRRIAPLLAYHDIDPGEVRFIGTSLWEEPDLGREPSLVGGWFAAPSPAESAAFLARFAETYGRRPPRIATPRLRRGGTRAAGTRRGARRPRFLARRDHRPERLRRGRRRVPLPPRRHRRARAGGGRGRGRRSSCGRSRAAHLRAPDQLTGSRYPASSRPRTASSSGRPAAVARRAPGVGFDQPVRHQPGQGVGVAGLLGVASVACAEARAADPLDGSQSAQERLLDLAGGVEDRAGLGPVARGAPRPRSRCRGCGTAASPGGGRPPSAGRGRRVRPPT